MRRVPPLSAVDLTSLDERLGLLLVLRAALVAAVATVAATVPAELAAPPGLAVSSGLAYLAVAGLAEVVARFRTATRLPLHRVLIPFDVLWLAWVLVPAGGAIRPTVLAFAVDLVAVTLLASVRNGVRVALWDTAVLVGARAPWLADRLAAARAPAGVAPAAGTALAVGGLWTLLACAGWFSAVNERELRRAKRELASLTAMAARLEALPPSGDVLGGLLAALEDAFEIDRAVAIWDDEEHVETRGVAGRRARRPVEGLSCGLQPGWSDEVSAEVWSTRSPVLVTHLPTAGVLAGVLPAARRVVVLPLGPDGGHRGVVAVSAPGPAGPSRRTVAALSQFSAHATLVLRNARLLAERERLARVDGLTGLANRRALDATLAAEVDRSRRGQGPLSLVVVDVDHFKRVNDERGHQAGDEVLRVVGRVLAGAVRASDTAARYGGEEFALVLPSCGVDGAFRVAEAARAAVSSHPELGGLTVSAGVATLGPGEDAAGLVRAADAALYRSKRAGRDRVTVAGPDHEPAAGDLPALDLREPLAPARAPAPGA